MGTYLDRTHDGVLGPEPHRAYVPHGIAGWNPEMGKDVAQRVLAVGDRIRGLAEKLPQHRAMQWCLNRSEGIATSDMEGISTTLKSLSLLESLRAERDPERQERDRQALGAVRLTAHAVEVGRRADASSEGVDLLGMHQRLFEGTNVRFELGRTRSDDVRVGSEGATPPEALFVAPPAEYVDPLCEDLADYVSAHDLQHPLVKAAVAHLRRLRRRDSVAAVTSSVRPFCWPCAHYRPSRVYRDPETDMSIGACKAFPDGIPDEIAVGMADHREPYDGDGGVRYEHRQDLAALGWTTSRATEFLDRKVEQARG